MTQSAAIGSLPEKVSCPNRPDIDITAELDGQAGRKLRCEIPVAGDLQEYVTVVHVDVMHIAANFELRCNKAADAAEHTEAGVVHTADRRVDLGTNEARVDLDIPVLLQREDVAGADLEGVRVDVAVQVERREACDAEPAGVELERTAQLESIASIIDIDVAELTE